MRDSSIKISYDSYIEDLFNEFSHPDLENSPCQGIENVSIFVNKKRWKKRKKQYVFEHAQQPPIAFRLSRLSKPTEKGLNTRHSSMPELSKCTRLVPPRIRSGNGNYSKHNKYKQSPFQSKFIANVFSEHRFDNWFLNPNYPSQTKWKIYRCQLGAVEDSCCCSCNSDAMFEVMKGLYDCYKAKNCDGCDCVLCGYKTKEERKIDELRKSMTSAAREKVLEGKTPEEKEFILKEMAKTRQPLPSGKTPSDKALIEKTRKELGLPPSPKTASEKAKMRKAEAAGIITPLEGKTDEEKEDILRAQADMGLKLPEGRTDSEKALIAKVKASKKRPLKTALLTPLSGKTPEEKEKILRGRAMKGLPLPEPQSPSEKKLIAKVRADLGLPKEPTTKSLREKYDQAAKAGLLQPLEGKTPAEKEKTLKGLRSLGIPLPEGRTPSEKALIAKVKASPRSIVAPSEQMRRAKAEGLITPLTGKTPEQKEKIIKGLAMKGLPLPEAASPSEKKLIDKVRADLGLPKEPTTKSLKEKFEQAAKAGLLQPLEGMTPEEKEKTLKGLHDLGIPLPEGRTPSEKAIVAKVKSSPRAGSIKTAGVMTPLTGKPLEQKEKILRKRAMKGIPLPEGVTPSEKKLIEKVRADLGLPKEPTTKSLREKYDQAAKAGLLQPLEGKTPEEKEKTLKDLRSMGIPLPEGRTPSEKALIAKVKASPRSIVAPSEQMRRAKAEGLITPLTGKTPEQKEKIIKGLAMKGLPLPEATSPSEKKLIDKVRADLGLPKEPTTKSLKEKFEQAAKAGLMQPLEGMTPEEKEKTLKGLHDLGIPLPEGRTPSEKALVAKVKSSPRAGSIKTAGVMTPLTGKPPEQKEKILRKRAMKGIPLPEGVTPSEKKLVEKVRADLGLPMEPTTKSLRDKHEQAAKAGLLEPLEGKTPAQKEAQLKGLRDMGIPLPEGRTPSEKALIAKVKAAPRSLVAPSEQLRRAKAEGLMTPLAGKTPAQKEKILKGLAMKGLPLPEGKSPSEKKLIDKVRDDLGLPKEPDTKSMKEKYDQAAKAGFLQPLLGKTPEEKEKILQGQHELGIPLPEGRTPSEKALIAKVKAEPVGSIKTAGVMTPLTGKSQALKEKVLRKRAMKGIPLPEGVTPSEKKIIDKVRADLGLPKEPTTKSLRDKHEQAAKAGLLEPLEGKTPAQKEAQLKGLRDMGIPLPEGRTPSEKALIAKVKAAPRSLVAPSEQFRRAKAEGLMTPLTGKTPAQKEKILKGLAMKGLPLPEGKSPSEKKLIDKVRDDLGLPKEPDTKSMKEKYDQAAKAGLLQPLLGKTPEEKEKILQGQRDLGIPLPEGRTPSEKALVAKIRAAPPSGSIKTAGVMTPLTGKSPAHQEKVLRARAMKGIPLPEGVTPSEKKIIDKVRADLGLPKEPTTKSLRDKHEQAAKAGLLEPLEGKTPAQKEAQLKGLRDMGIPLPEGRTPSEKALIAKVKAAPRSLVAPSEQFRRAKAEGLMTPLAGKTPAQKEKILKGLAMKGLPLPEGKSPSEKKLIDKVRDDLGLPKEPDTKSMKEKYDQAAKAGFLQPLLGKTPEEKEKILQGQHELGIPLPEGRTPSEKALIAKVKAEPVGSIKTAGVMTPLTGKSPALKEKVLRKRAMKGIPLPEGVTPSEKKIIDKVRADLGLPKEPTTKSLRDKHEQAAKAGLLEPLEGKTPAQKEAQLKGLRDMGIPLPEGRTPSEKALIAKVKGAPRSLVAPSEQLRRAKAEGLMTPLTGKTPAQKEKILKGLAMKGLPLPEGKSPSEKKLIDKVRDDLGLPKEPDTKSMKDKYDEAAKAGLLQPLLGKTPEEKEKILQGQHDLGIPLPEGRTPSEKALIAKIKATPPAGSIKTAGIMTPLTGKPPALKEKVLRKRAMKGIPLPEGTTPSEKKIIDKVRADLGLPKEPTTKSLRDKHEQAAKAGLLEPLEGKTPAQKEAQLKGLRDMGIPLPEGRTPSEKALIAKVKAAPRSLVAPSEQMRRAKAEGLMTPLTGKTPAQKEKILKGLAMKGLPLPEGKSPSEKKLIDKVREDLGLPKEPDTKSMKDKYDQAAKAGLLQPLLGKTPEEKEKILQGQRDLGIPLPEGRTPSEKALVAKIRAAPPSGSIKTAGVMTPLTGKSPAHQEKVLRARAMKGIPLPEGVTPSEKKIIDKVRADLGLPKEPTTKSLRDKHEQAAKAGLLEPLEGKTPAQKEAQLKGLRDMGIPLPEGRTPSEKALIAKVKGAPRSLVAPSEQMRRAKAEGLMTPLAGKTPAQKEKILKGLAMKGLPLPEGKSPSEKKLIDKVRDDLGLPKEPDTKSMKEKYDQAAKAGFLQPLLGKTPEEKEKILQGQHELGIPLPEGRTPSEKALIAKVKAEPVGSIKTAGVMTPLTGKSPALKEKVLRKRAMKGIPLPEGVTPSEKKIIDKVRADLGLPKEPTTKSLRDKHEQAAKAGLLEPLEGKTPAQKEAQLKGLRDMGIPLPEGRTPSEKALIAKVKGAPRSLVAPSEQMRRAKAEGLMTPLAGKTPAQKEKILKGLAMKGLPLPEGKSPSEKKLIDKVREDLGLPKEPDTKSMKDKYDQAAKAGFLQPLLGKTPEEKEKILQGQRDLGIPLPEGRTPSEKALVAKIRAAPPSGSIKTAGVMTPLTGKSPAHQEKVLRARAMKGIPLPEGVTPSEKKIIDKVRADLGLPKEPTTKSLRDKHEQAAKAGLLEPLEGKTPAQKEAQLKGLRDMGIPLPEGRTPSEKALIAKVKGAPRSLVAPSEQMRRAKAEGLMTPLTGKTPAQKEKILKGLAMKGLPLPEGKSPSEKKLIDRVRDDLGLPKEPDTKSMKEKYDQAAKAGFLQPLLGKTPEEKEKILQGQHELGIPLPEGRTPSEKALIAKVKAEPVGSIKTAGVMTPLTGKSPALKEKVLRKRAMKGIPLPEGVTPSEKKIIDKVRADLGLPKEPTTKSLRDKHEQAAKAGLLEPLEGKTPAQKEAQLKGLRDMGIPLPEGRTPSEKALIAKVKGAPRSLVAPSEQLRRAKAEGLMTPLTGKTPAQKEKILKGLAMKGLPLPEGKSPSEKKLIDKVRDDLGLPKEPDTKSMKDKYDEAAKAGLLQPLVGKTPEEKEKILQGQHDLGIPLPEGRTPSEKALIAKIKATPPAGSIKTAGIMTPLTGKPPALKEKVLRKRAMKGIPLPEGTTPSEKKIIDKVRADLGLPKEPTTKSLRDKHEQAAKAGLLEPLEGKTPAQKEAQLKGLRDMGIPLPEGRTPSEKALIAKVKAAPRSLVAPSEQMRRAKAEGLITPLTGKTPAQKEKILKGLAMKGLPLPEGKSPSEKKLIDKVREDLGLPKEPDTKSMKDKYDQAAKAGLLQPLLGKTPEEKEKILQGQHDLGIPLPEGRTPSEKALIDKIKAAPPAGSIKTAGLMTPLTGKSPAHKEKVLRARAMKGIPLPEGVTPSEKKIIDKVRADLGLPKEPTTKSLRDKHEQAAKAGLLEPLEGKTPAQKEAQLKGLRDMGIPLPEGRTPSEKALIAKVKGAPRSLVAPSEQMRRAKAEGLMTPLAGKTPAQKEKILKGLAMKGLPLPEGKSPSEKKLIDKVRDDLGLPKEPDTKSMKEKYDQAAKAGFLQPLLGKTPEEKEKILQGQHELGIPLPEGRTPSEKALIAKVKAEPVGSIKTAGVMTPLTGKSPALKEKVLRARAMKGIPLPEGATPSEKKIIDKVRADLGLPKEPTTKSLRDKHEQAAKAGLLEPLEGKTPAQKEAQLKGLRDMGIPLPEGRTPSEKALIAKVKGAPRSVVAPSEQMRRAKAEGLITPLTGKTPAQKEKILKGLAMKGLPLPEGKSPSEKKLIDKVRDDLGLPKEPETKSMKDKYDQAAKAGLLQPLVGKTPEEKEKILQGQHDLGIPLPEGRTPSEKALIAKVKAAPRAVVAPSEQLRRAKAEGLLTPLKGKTPEQKEKIVKGLAMKGLQLPEPQTPSEKKLIDKVRAELGLPKEPTTKSLREKFDQAAKAGLLQPLEGKTPEEKEKTLKGLQDLGIPLPEGRTPSEKAIVAKVKASAKKAESVPTITTEKIQKAKDDGLFTPLKGKTPEQKEKILQGLAEAGLPLPEGKTPSDRALIKQVKKEFGIPERTPLDKLRRAKAAGLLTPLEGKTPAQKEKILRGRAAAGLPLPMAKTPSEKSLIKKIKDETGYVTPSPADRIRRAKAAGIITPLKGKSPSMKEKILQGMKAAGVPIPEGETPSEKKLISKFISKPKIDLEGVPSDKVRAAKAAGLLTPLEGKTPAEKEKIIKGLAEAGLPLPEGKTKSEKSMISKIKARTPPEGKTPSEKSIIGKAKAAGLFTPITGKAPAEKERILKGLAEAGLPLPEGKTASEKDLVKKIRAQAGLPLEATPSEKKGKIRKKEKKVGVSASKKAAGISAEEFEDVIKTTKCDRGCGCDRKKIRFKHSYVKIRVTSPDISSFCDCPGECFPQVKNGAFIDNDGIKVTVGSAVGIPSYSMVCINQLMPDATVSNTDVSKTQTNYNNNITFLEKTKYKLSSFESGPNNNNNNNTENENFNVSSSDVSFSTKPYNTQSENNYVHSSIAHYHGRTSLKDIQLLEDIYKEPMSNTKSASSFDTILIIRNDMSLSTSTSNSMDTISLTSVMNSSITSSSAHYSGYQSTNDLLSMNSLDDPTTSDDFIDHPTIRERNALGNIGAAQRYTILRMSQLEDNFGNNKMKKTMKESETDDPIVLFNKLPSKLDVSKIMFKLMSKKRFACASSIFIVVPKSEDEEEQDSINCVDSMTSMRSSECCFTVNTTSLADPDPALKPRRLTERDEQICRKGKTFYLQEKPSYNDTETTFQNESEPDLRRIEMMKDEFCQISRSNGIAEMLQKAAHGVGTIDTSADEPCCSSKDLYTAKSISRRITPFFLKGKSFSWFRCKKSTESSVNDILQWVGPSFSPVPPCRRCLHGRSQQQQTTKSASVSDCSSGVLKVKRNRTATVQQPSVESRSTRHEGRTIPKKTGVAWFRSGLRKASASSSVPGYDIPLCSDLSYSAATSYDTRPHARSQQQRTPVSSAPGSSGLSDLEVTGNPSVKVGKSYSWFRMPGTRKAFVSCDIPPCYDYRLCPAPPNHSRHHDRGQNHIKTNPLDYSKVARNPTAKVGKSYSWFHLPGKRKANCDIPPSRDYRFCPSPNHSCQQGRVQHIHKKTYPRDDLKVTRNPPDKVQKPCIESTRHQGRFRLPGMRKGPARCGTPPTCKPKDNGLKLHQQPLVKRNRPDTVQKPCTKPTRQEGETTPKTAGVPKRLSWTRLRNQRKKSAPSIPTCSVPQYLDSSCSPVPPEHPGHLGRNQQNQTPASASPGVSPPGVSPPGDLRLKGTRTAKVQKPSIGSIYHEGENPQKITGVSLSWSLFPRVTSTRKTSVPSMTARDVPQYLDSSCSPVPPDHPRLVGCNQQNQTSATTSLCAYPPDDSEVKRRRSGMRISWSRLPNKRKTSVPSIPPCSVPRYQHASTSPVPPHHPRQYDHNQQSQTSATTSLPEDSEGRTTRTAKVQKPSIESIYHEGQTTSKITGVTMSWSLLPSKRKTSEPSIPTCGLLQGSLLHGRSEQTQTPESLRGYPTYDFKEMRNLTVKEQEDNTFVETIRKKGGLHHKYAGIVSGWFHLPSMTQVNVSVKDPNILKNTQSQKTSKPNTVTLSDSKPEPGDQPTGGQITRPQKLIATKQKDPREICCPYRNPKSKIPMHTEPAKEMTETVKLPDPKDQQPAKLANEITPVHQKLTSFKTVDKKGEKRMSRIELESFKDLKSSKTKKQSKKDKSKQTVTLSDSKLSAGGQMTFRQKDVQTICHPCPKQYQLSHPELTKEIVKLPVPLDQQLEKIAKELTLVQQKLANIKTFEQKGDKPMSSIKLDSPKDPKGTQTIGVSKENKLKPNTETLTDSIPEPGGQLTIEQIPHPQQISSIKEKISREICCPFRKRNLISQPDLTKELVKLPDPIDLQSANLAKEIKPEQQKLASPKNVEQKERELMCECKENKLKQNTITLSDSKPEPGGQPIGGQISRPQKLFATKQKDPRDICCPYRKQIPVHTEPAKEKVKLPGPKDQQPAKLANEITPDHQKLTSIKTVDKKGEKRMSHIEFESSKDPKSSKTKKESKKDKSKHTVTLTDSKLAAGGRLSFRQKDVQTICRPCPKQYQLPHPELEKEIVKLPEPIDQQLEKNAKELPLVQQKLASIKTFGQKGDKPLSSIKLDSPKDPKDTQTIGVSKEDKPKPNTETLTDSIPEPGGQLTIEQIPHPQQISSLKEKISREICCPFRKRNLISQPDLTKELVKLPDPIDLEPTNLAKEIKPEQQKLASSKNIEQKERELMCECKKKKLKQNTITLSDLKPEPDQPMSRQIPQPQEIPAIEPKDSLTICRPCSKQYQMPQPESTKEVVNLPNPRNEQQPEKLENKITPVEQKLASSKTVEPKAEESVCKCKEEELSKEVVNLPNPRNEQRLKEMKNGKSSTKITKLFVDMRKTIIPRINETLKSLAGQKGPGNPKDPSTIQLKSPKTNKEKEREVVCECKEGKPMSTKDLNNPGTSGQKEREVKTKRSEEKTKDLESLKTIKKKEKVTCKCKKYESREKNVTKQLPRPRQKRCPPRLPPVLLGLPPVATPEGYFYEGIGPSCKWLDTGVIKRLRSELTHSTSGFKACKRRKLQKSQVVDNIELDFGDAVRYFASMNPERFQQLIQEELESQLKAEENKRVEEKKRTEQLEKARKKSKKEARKGKVDKTTTIDKFPISDKSESDYPQGLKFSIVVKDGPTALAGVDCTKFNRSS